MKAFSTILVLVGLIMSTYGAWIFVESKQGQKDGKAAWVGPRTTFPLRLSVPGKDVEEFVMSGATNANLSKGPAWLPETAMPGASGNVVIAGHRDTHFRFLRTLKSGEEIHIEDGFWRFRYRIISMNVVDPSDVRLLEPTRNEVLTLVTCYPFQYVGSAPERYIIRASFIGAEAQTLAKTNQ